MCRLVHVLALAPHIARRLAVASHTPSARSAEGVASLFTDGSSSIPFFTLMRRFLTCASTQAPDRPPCARVPPLCAGRGLLVVAVDAHPRPCPASQLQIEASAALQPFARAHKVHIPRHPAAPLPDPHTVLASLSACAVAAAYVRTSARAGKHVPGEARGAAHHPHALGCRERERRGRERAQATRVVAS